MVGVYVYMYVQTVISNSIAFAHMSMYTLAPNLYIFSNQRNNKMIDESLSLYDSLFNACLIVCSYIYDQ